MTRSLLYALIISLSSNCLDFSPALAQNSEGKIGFAVYGLEDVYSVMNSDGSGCRKASSSQREMIVALGFWSSSEPSQLRKKHFTSLSSLLKACGGSSAGRGTMEPAHDRVGFLFLSLTADNKRVLYRIYHERLEQYQVRSVNLDGTNDALLISPVHHDTPSVSPDRKKITYGAYDGDSCQIYIINTDGTEKKRLTNVPNAKGPRFIEDGTKIAFDSFRDGERDIYVIDSDGTNDKRLTFTTGRPLTDESMVCWFPSGAPSTITVNDVSVVAEEKNTQSAVFTVSLSTPSSVAVFVDYATADGTAVGNEDYEPSSGTIIFSPYETKKSFSVQVRGKLPTGAEKEFFVNLESAGNATIADKQGVGVILSAVPIGSKRR